MITPQDIREKQFERAMLNGYSAASVDKFMEEVALEYAARCKEISTYRKKLKMLVNKVEEYRTSEDAMRMALLQAQKTCTELTEAAQKSANDTSSGAQAQADALFARATEDSAAILFAAQQKYDETMASVNDTISGAQAQADALFARATEDSAAILFAAQQKYDETIASISDAAEQEEARLAEAQQKALQFAARMREFCQSQIMDLDAFEASLSSKLAEAQPAPVVEEPIVEEPVVEESVVEEPVVEEPAVEEPVVEEPVVEEPVVEEPAVEEPVVEEPAVEEPIVEEAEDNPLASLWSDSEIDAVIDDMGDPLASLWGDPSEDFLAEDDTDNDTKRFNFDDLKGLNFGR